MASIFRSLSNILGGGNSADGALNVPEEAFPPGTEFAPDACFNCPSDCDEKLKVPADILKEIDFKEPIANSVKPYDRHVFVRVDNSLTWPSQVEKLPIIEAAAKCVKDKSLRKQRILLSAADATPFAGESPRPEGTFSALLYPDGLEVDVTIANAESKLAELLQYADQAKAAPDTLLPAGITKISAEKFLFVCGHQKRDDRCGVVGPSLVSALRESSAKLNLDSSIKVLACSHVGGHKYAGNLIAYPAGVWLGRVAPYHAEVVLREVVQGGKVIRGLWRGQLGWCKGDEK
ncbi:hypothetical protein M427DRAFT_134861 [Gonapodya prolifera JEL478]|uniref:Sucraseferredoxin-like protein n=1 Tax=Gonapodya prolifera (strain JEL478) TaxID=1344416 RepID=A0A139AHF4_GONPJ|nr:hypothetical protein M427DRAFT_134861 [Gonapodya prolifera JEL478]|eukprot:KXS15843.1 hypothetical protein M427DRAFT_134861 [Gonapodya prolifera JEL478]